MNGTLSEGTGFSVKVEVLRTRAQSKGESTTVGGVEALGSWKDLDRRSIAFQVRDFVLDQDQLGLHLDVLLDADAERGKVFGVLLRGIEFRLQSERYDVIHQRPHLNGTCEVRGKHLERRQ